MRPQDLAHLCLFIAISCGLAGCSASGGQESTRAPASAAARNPSQPGPAHLSGTADTIPTDPVAVEEAEAAARNADFSFSTSQEVDGLSYGLVGDGETDNTAVFRTLLAGGNRTIHVPAGDYVTDKLEFEANTSLVLEPGVTIRDAGRLGKLDRLLNIRTRNVRITGFGARVIANREDYREGEWRHGVYIYGASKVLIEGLESSSQGGDGFYIGGPAGKPSTDVQIRGCRADNNRRQGLSITSARRVQIVDCQFTRTNGTSPQFGIDLEPNADYDSLDHIVILRAQTASNAGGGIMIQLIRLLPTSAPVDVTIIDHSSEAERPHLFTRVPSGVGAVLRYGGSDAGT
jgi:polygalacturonase